VFDDDRLDAVIPQLERWYDLDIHLDDPSLGAERITIVFTTESPDEALSTLAKVLDLRVTRTGRSVRFAPLRPRR
jgi:ferric-dicitrate binding protein FerR (iron transport regulator)